MPVLEQLNDCSSYLMSFLGHFDLFWAALETASFSVG